MIKVQLLDQTYRIYILGTISHFDEDGANVVMTFADLTTQTLVYTTLIALQEDIGGR